jgi:hypothetical protein
MHAGQSDRGGPRHGTVVPRGQQVEPGASPPEGRFGRMFPCLQPCDPSDAAIDALVKLMGDRAPGQPKDNPSIPAGFTYLGQFIDHDITFDPTSKLDQVNDPRALVNFRTPRFDLDSVYGAGPEAQPFLYDWGESKPRGTRLLVGDNRGAWNDLPRNQQGRALIGDARNDENVIVAQLHLLFIRFHNAVVNRLCGQRVPEKEIFDEAQRIVRWHYQWIVVHEFLPKVVGKPSADLVLEPAPPGTAPTVHRKYFAWQREPFIPVEFSGAAFRFGHSMVRAQYGLKRRAGRAVQHAVELFPKLSGLRRLPDESVIDWERFFELPGVARPPQSSHRINTTIVKPLFRLPERDDGELPRLNLRRGRDLGLPSGQDVACVMHEPALTKEELLLAKVPAAVRDEILRATPLWYYILCEAAKELDGEGRPQAGTHLGPVGGRIVAEVLVGLLEGDPSSYLSVKPKWYPRELGPRGDFTMADLVKFAQRPAAGARRRSAPPAWA